MTEKQKILRDIKKFGLQDPENFKKYIEKLVEDIHKKTGKNGSNKNSKRTDRNF